MENCIFCKIVNQEIPASIIYEDATVVALLDIAQTTPGHTLLIIKQHADNLTLSQDHDLAHAIKIAKKLVAKQLKTLPNITGVNVINNVLAGAGQSVMHTHIHLVPRYHDDGFNISWKNHHGAVSANTLKELAKALKL